MIPGSAFDVKEPSAGRITSRCKKNLTFRCKTNTISVHGQTLIRHADRQVLHRIGVLITSLNDEAAESFERMVPMVPNLCDIAVAVMVDGSASRIGGLPVPVPMRRRGA